MEPPLPRRLVTGVRMMKPDVRAFFDEDTFTVSYVVSDPATKACAIVDSVLDFDPASGRTTRHSADAIIAFVRQQGLAVEWIIATHVHADHLSAAPYLDRKSVVSGKRVSGRLNLGGGRYFQKTKHR